MKHLEFAGAVWCDGEENADIGNATEDPRDATCADCLRRAASYGAAAAMRYAAVEAGSSRDPELARERDEAMRQLNTINRAITKQGGFFCTACQHIRPLNEHGLVVNGVVWCTDCAPHGRVTS